MSSMKNKPNGQAVSVCLRCGAIGTHQTCDCKSDIPTIQSLETQIKDRIDFALSHIPSGWQKDQFGYYQPSTKPPLNIPDQPNCSNCGDFGHTTEECTRPNRNEVHMKFGQLLNQAGHIANEERKDIVNSIKEEYYPDLL